MSVLARVVVLSLGVFGLIIRRFIYLGFGSAWAVMLPAMRRRVVRVRNRRLHTLVRSAAIREAVPVDDWDALRAEPDGGVVSLVGWASGHAQLSAQVGGEPCIGVALGCQHNFPGVFESIHDFNLRDEAGRQVTIQVEGARLVGEPHLQIFGTHEARLLHASLDLPATATPTGDVYALRDGDPVMVIGFKAALPPDRARAEPRVVVRSAAPRPLLIYPIKAERRPAVEVEVEVDVDLGL
jgi:hypothetical protein